MTTDTQYHGDHTITVWNIYTQSWTRTGTPSDRLLASLNPQDRQRAITHTDEYECEDFDDAYEA